MVGLVRGLSAFALGANARGVDKATTRFFFVVDAVSIMET